MKQKEFTKCIVCDKGMMHRGDVTFYRIKIDRFIVDVGAFKEAHGLETMLGHPQLAAVMGPDKDLAVQLVKYDSVLICETCATRGTPVAHLNEMISERDEPLEENEEA